MIHNLQWFPIAIKLRDYLKSYRYKDGSRLFEDVTDRDDLQIRVGAGNVGEYPAIWILFGDEHKLDKQDSINGGVVQLWIDIYVKGEAGPEIDFDDSCYRQLYCVEQEFMRILRKFQMYLRDLGLIVDFNLQDVLSDGDENAPVSVQNRIVLDIEYYKNKC